MFVIQSNTISCSKPVNIEELNKDNSKQEKR